jgi:hypothetical protein
LFRSREGPAHKSLTICCQIDHLYAVKTIDEVHRAGGKVKAFISYCGGLPAPESADNPLGYKFSWSSRGVLLALLNSAKLYSKGELVEVDGKDLMKHAQPYYINPAFAFVAYPNRDSTPFREFYEIPEAETVVRGTLRYQGFPAFIKALVDIGFLNESPVDFLAKGATPLSWAEVTQRALGAQSADEAALIAAVKAKTSFPSEAEEERILSGLRWIGLFSQSEKVVPRGDLLDTLCATLEAKMQYEKGERDMVMLQHKFEIENADGSKVRARHDRGIFSSRAKRRLLTDPSGQTSTGDPDLDPARLRRAGRHRRPVFDGQARWRSVRYRDPARPRRRRCGQGHPRPVLDGHRQADHGGTGGRGHHHGREDSLDIFFCST